jgi:hypothetical protein
LRSVLIEQWVAARVYRMMKPSLDPTALAASLASSSGGDGKDMPAHAAGTRPDPVIRGDFDMRIARDGTWFYHGSPIARKPLVKLFASVLGRDEDGVYWLTTPVEKGRVEVDDAPFLAVGLEVAGAGRDQVLRFRTNVDDEVTADADHPIRVALDAASREPAPYLLVRGRLEALIARSVFYELVELGVEEALGGETQYGVWSAGSFFAIGSLEDAP